MRVDVGSLDFSGGSIGGTLAQGAGNDRLEVQGGTVTGAATQGSGDDVAMVSAGSLASLDQGDGADSLQVSGGSITGTVQQGNGIDSFNLPDLRGRVAIGYGQSAQSGAVALGQVRGHALHERRLPRARHAHAQHNRRPGHGCRHGAAAGAYRRGAASRKPCPRRHGGS